MQRKKASYVPNNTVLLNRFALRRKTRPQDAAKVKTKTRKTDIDGIPIGLPNIHTKGVRKI
jgi:hypothetical protein